MEVHMVAAVSMVARAILWDSLRAVFLEEARSLTSSKQDMVAHPAATDKAAWADWVV